MHILIQSNQIFSETNEAIKLKFCPFLLALYRIIYAKNYQNIQTPYRSKTIIGIELASVGSD